MEYSKEDIQNIINSHYDDNEVNAFLKNYFKEKKLNSKNIKKLYNCIDTWYRKNINLS